jgi:hypothetical protein
MDSETSLLLPRAAVTGICTFLVILLLSACGPARQEPIPEYEFQQYSMFSWKTDADNFCFVVMIQAESHKFLRSRIKRKNATCGISAVKVALAALPKHSVVLWQDWPPANLDYPPENVVQEVIELAKANGIQLKQSPALR